MLTGTCKDSSIENMEKDNNNNNNNNNNNK
jgi:hypothetical protein